jgi:hypothetical protein
MAQQESNFSQDLISDIAVKLRDIEEKQNLIKDRVLLLGENLVSEKEDTEKEMVFIKNGLSMLGEEIRKIKLNLRRIMEESEGFVRKNEFDILKRQFEMFQPLKLARIEDVRAIVQEELKKN